MTLAASSAMPGRRTAIAAHRGGAGLWPENSRQAFRQSATMGVEFVEFDVHRTADGQLVVHHDPDLGRTSDGSGEIAAMRWHDVKRVPLRDAPGECIPHLDEVLAILAPSPVDLRLEIKQPRSGHLYDGIEAALVHKLQETGLLERTTFTSFDARNLEVLRNRHGHGRLILLVRSEEHEARNCDVDQACHKALAVGAPEIAIRAGQIRPGDVERCREKGIRLGAFAVNDQVAIDWALAAGLCAFTTDRPDLALSAREPSCTSSPDGVNAVG
jgi:glycerophosphoryl diester phosphodiesterase